MADVTFDPPATVTGPDTSSDPETLLAVATIASKTDYTATTNDAVCLGWDYIVFRVVYTKGDEDSVNFKAQGYDGANWTDLGYKATQATSVSAISVDLMQMTATTTVALPPVSCRGFQKLRLSIKANNGTPTGTIGVTATAAIEAAGSRNL